jgi:predicted dehydrogenase
MTGALRDELAYFASCVLEGRQPTRVTGEDAVLALDVANRIREAAADSGSESSSIDADGTGRTSRTPE